MEPMKGKLASSQFDLGTLSNFAFLRRHQCSSRLVTVILGNLLSSIKQIEAPYMFDWENAIALHAMKGHWSSSGSGGSLMGFLYLWQKPRLYSRVTTGRSIPNLSLFSEVRTPV